MNIDEMKNDKIFEEYLHEIVKQTMCGYDCVFQLFFDDEKQQINANWTEFIYNKPYLNSQIFMYDKYDEYKNKLRLEKINSI